VGMSYINKLDSRVVVIVYHAMIRHGDVLMVTWSTLGDMPDEPRYILEMGIELEIASLSVDSGWDPGIL